MIKFICLIAFAACICGPQLIFSQTDMQKQIESVKQADIDFSNLSKEKGMKEAFLAYVAADGVMLRPNMMPVVGYDEIKKLLEDGEIEFHLTWEPLYGDVSSSGDIGYTYGTYELVFKKDVDRKDVRRGTYATVWKKDQSGKWKWVLDTGNPGLEPKKE